MALTIDISTNEMIDVGEYVDYVNTYVDPYDNASICESAHKLKALANNRQFMVEQLNRELMAWQDFQPLNRYTAQTFIFAHEKNFVLRANIWVPPSTDQRIQTAIEKLGLYEVPHDHNFSFLTIGYLGSGYETTIYEYDPASIEGRIGEEVRLHFLEKTTLPKGKIMFYRASRDVHSQGNAIDFSISINLLINTPDIHDRTQYLFDIERRTIAGLASAHNTSRIMICNLARHIGNTETFHLLDQITQKHVSERVRAEAYGSLAAMQPTAAENIWRKAEKDPHPLVRSIARERRV